MKLAAVGSNCIDYYNNLNGGKAFPGGGPVNMAVYTVRLGGKAAYIGPVGNDSYGEMIISAVKKKVLILRIYEWKQVKQPCHRWNWWMAKGFLAIMKKVLW